MDRTFQQVPASKETKVKEPEVQEPDVREPEFVVPANTEHELPAGEEVTMTFEPTTPDPLPAVDKQADKEPDFEIEVAEDDDENYRGKETEPYNPKLDLENYRFPTIDLMRHYENNEPTINMEEQNANKDKIINTLRSFGIEDQHDQGNGRTHSDAL